MYLSTETMTHTVRKVYKGLRERLLSQPPGSRVPSIRKVMKAFEVSQITVDKALDQLQQDGLIIRRPNELAYVAEEVVGRKRRIAIVIPVDENGEQGYTNTCHCQHLRQALHRLGEIDRIVYYPAQDRVFRAEELVGNPVDAAIIIPTALKMLPSDLAELAALPMPYVFLGYALRNLAIDCVEQDNERGGELAAEYLVGLGHRTLAFLYSEPHNNAGDDRWRGFRQQARLMGVNDIEMIDCGVASGEFSAEKAYDVLRARNKKNGTTFSGLFVVSDLSALGAMKALTDCGLAIPGDVSVVGYDDIPQVRYYSPALTTIRGDFREVSEAAVDVIERRLNGSDEPPIQRALTPKLIERDSTCPVRG